MFITPTAATIEKSVLLSMVLLSRRVQTSGVKTG
jgi:hypothetical protein